MVGLVVVVDITHTTSTELSSSEISHIENVVAAAYGVGLDDVSSSTEYMTSGSMAVTVPESSTEEEFIDALIDAMSTALGIPSEDIDIMVDVESGEVAYTVRAASLNETISLRDALGTPEIVQTLNTVNNLVNVESVTPNEDIVAEIIVSVDGDNVTVSIEAAESTVEVILGDEYTSSAEMKFVTSSPTVKPSSTPSRLPSSSIPSPLPTISGAVVYVEMYKGVTASLSATEISDLISAAEEAYGVFPGSVEAAISYETTGFVTVTLEGAHSEDEIVEALVSSIAHALEVHPRDVEISSYDGESGIATYIISGSTLSEVQDIQLAMSTSDVANALVESLEASIDGEIINISVETDVPLIADVLLTVDATNTADVNLSMSTLENDLSNDWTISSTCINLYSLFVCVCVCVHFIALNFSFVRQIYHCSS